MTALQKSPDDLHKKLSADGQLGVVDIARRVLGDVRAMPLLLDLNPGLKPVGAVPAGTIIVIPSKNQLRAFARRHGIALGFDERRDNGTAARRAWARLQGQAAAVAPAVDAVALARSLLAHGISPTEAGRRVNRQCPGADLALLARSDDARLKQVAHAAASYRLHPRAQSRLANARGILETTLRPGGFRALLEALARAPEEGRALLASLAVAPALVEALVDAAAGAVHTLQRARRVAGEERGVRDLVARDEPALRSFVAAFVDGVEPMAGDRLDGVGLRAEHDALVDHIQRIVDALRKAADALPRSTVDVVRATAEGGDASSLPRPWPLVVRVVCAIADGMTRAGAGAMDLGLGGLVVRAGASRSVEGAPVVALAALRARAVPCAQMDDQGEALAARLSRSVVSLFTILRPSPHLEGRSARTTRMAWRAAFDGAMTAHGPVTASGIRALVEDSLAAARAADIGKGDRLTPVQVEALRRACDGFVEPMSVARRPLSEMGRALVLVAMALEPDLAGGLARPTGREAYVQTAKKHAARVLSRAACTLC